MAEIRRIILRRSKIKFQNPDIKLQRSKITLTPVIVVDGLLLNIRVIGEENGWFFEGLHEVGGSEIKDQILEIKDQRSTLSNNVIEADILSRNNTTREECRDQRSTHWLILAPLGSCSHTGSALPSSKESPQSPRFCNSNKMSDFIYSVCEVSELCQVRFKRRVYIEHGYCGEKW